MEMYLQFGHGMMEHCRTLVRSWRCGSVILSPRDLSPAQLQTMANDITAAGGSVYVDPQFYLPHADHYRLVSHPYWPQGYESAGFWPGPDLTDLINELRTLNNSLGTVRMILPGVLGTIVDADWLGRQTAVQAEAIRLGLQPEGLLATVALNEHVVRNVNQVQEVLEAGRGWKIGGVYLVCEHPDGAYLVQDAIWVSNVLELMAGFRLQGKFVIQGYCNHQMLAAACCSANAIASGTWLNVRSFPPEKFQTLDEEIKRKTKWYYCPRSLSEYKMPTLDIAMVQGLLPQMAPPPELGSNYADMLFQGVQPSLVDTFTEGQAFRHYLQCLCSQTGAARRGTFTETAAAHDQMLDAAEAFLDQLHAAGVRGQLRDFKECVDANRAALAVLRTNRGALLQRRWAAL